MTSTDAKRAPAESFDDVAVVERLLAERYSCRAFLPKPVPQATIESILRLAQRTASWCNSQPWQVVITRGAGTERFRDAIYRHASGGGEEGPDFPWPREYRGVYLARRRESGFQLYDAVGIGKGDMAARTRQALENFRLFGAPHVAIISTDEPLGVYGAVDCGAYVGTFLLAAQAHGVATIAQAALARHSSFVRQYFGLADDRRVVCGISFGFADHADKINSYRTSRADLAEAVTFVDQ
ncbi:MAG TPA: nitroreductase [Candidatus Sulfotelmatobacter sp.]|nr:nitroreductase [Candidatus Sulfotelmatobacter sp.]